MRINLVTALILTSLACATSAQAKQVDIKPPVSTVDLDRFYADPCYLSNCGSPTMLPNALANSPQRSVALASNTVYKTFQPSYTTSPGTTIQSSCTSLLGLSDNQFATVLTTGVTNPGSNRNIDLTFNAEGRIQRKDGDTANGIGAVGVQMLLTEFNAALPGGPTGIFGVPDDPAGQKTEQIFFRWIIHAVVGFSQVTDVPNPTSANQPLINSASVRRFKSLLVGSTYKIDVNAKWSDVFTGLTLEPATQLGVVEGGQGRGALICIPTLAVVEQLP